MAGLLGVALCASAAAEDAGGGRVELVLPRPASPGEEVWLQVKTGALPRGAAVEVATEDGTPVGSVSPFGAAAVRHGASYTIPLPAGAVRDGRLTLRVEIEQPGAAARAPQAGEVTVTPVYVPVAR
ncbi:hypothetical protein PQJ75_14095 [Rhodoplanes sp. TEM]|uniref:Uncharacterized protein n=1 Tax=Rhodoplanes tepidamans TaxID=200616 RepID=A0ABT5JJG2_RHOTP|nr:MULTISPECIES: hypothetical protein [Rhodoplanes]MDC7789871.1 hypothetical protein [Rhodoplanes tepidamans]MDC7984864.1 hypothetical protein [Rhodoplanes sp. TEM]MDQ0358453.1 hypothetical protein [Rhodoplanes tepidamans]